MIHPIKGQAVKFYEGMDFNARNKKCTGYNLDICQPVAKGMITRFQLLLGQKTGTQLIQNSDFLNDLSDWSPGAGLGIQHSAKYGGSMEFTGASSAVFEVQSVSVNANSYYYIEAKFRDIEPPNNLNPAITNLTPGIAHTGSGESNSIGDRTAKVWFESGSNTSVDISVRIVGSGFIEYVRMYELTQPTIEVKDSLNNVVYTPVVTYFEDRAIVSIDWNNISADTGKFKICAAPVGNVTQNLVACQNAILDNNGFPIPDNDGNCILG